MEINVKDKIKLVEIWLSHEDQGSQQTLETMQDIMEKYKESRYKTAIFYSGNRDLLASTEDLLRNNLK